ncbi:unnamed protein product [Effrenium voratum]|uniref:RRM domain-containing protein n=1 Tax=Effrenium voratum TaxID=2562239 RepID=A0AA36N2V5_9DINO|nr:unnamed protein product [Effrenium voratum]
MTEGKKLFVAKLPQDIRPDEIEEVFSTYGPVEEVVLMDASRSNRPDERTAFVIYKSLETARTAVQVLNEVYRFREDSPDAIHVSYARPPRGKGDAKGDGKGKDKGYGSSYSDRGGSYETPSGRPVYRGDQGTGDGYARGGYQARDMDPGAGYAPRAGREEFRGERDFSRNERAYDRGYDSYGPAKGHGHYDRPERALDGYRGSDRGYAPPAKDYDRRGYGGYERDAGNYASTAYRDDRAPRDDARRGGSQASGSKVYVGNLPTDISKEALIQVFGTYGPVDDVHIMTGRSKSGQASAFVRYSRSNEADNAIAAMATGYEIKPGDGNLVVRLADGEGPKGGGRGDRSRPY